MILTYNNKSVNYNDKWLNIDGSLPPDPTIGNGHWVHKDTGVITEFGLEDSSISGTTFNSPSWKNNASEIKVPEGVTTIAANSLSNSSDLETLILPSTITTIGNNILSNCTSFKKLYSYAVNAPSLTSLGTNVGDFSLQIKVQAESFDSYRLASGWSDYYYKLFVLNGLIPGSRVHSGYTVQTTPMTLNNPQNVIIENICFDSDYFLDSTSLLIWGGQNIIIRNCKFRGKSKRRAIHMDGSTNAVIYNCVFEECYMSNRITLSNGAIRIFSNDFIKPRGTMDGAWIMSGAVQLTYNQGGDYRVQDNVFEGEHGESTTEDVFNLYSCSFSDTNPLINRNNWVRNGGPGGSSGGALIGDDDGVIKSKRAIIEDNIFVEPGQYGISLAGGDYGTLRNNKVYGAQKPWSNVGLIAVNWAGDGSVGNIVENNQVKWTNGAGNNNPYWTHSSAGELQGWETNNFNAPIDETILPPKIATIFPGENNTIKGWYENTSFGKALIDSSSSFISGGVMSRPSWYNSAIRVFVPPWVTELNGTFNGASNLQKVILPEGLIAIGNNSFNGTVIEQLKIPESVTTIGNNNLNIKEIIFHSLVPPSIGTTQNMTNVELITVPDGSDSAYISAFTPFGKEGLIRQRNYDNGYVIATTGQTVVVDREYELIFQNMMVAFSNENKPFLKEVKVPGGVEYLASKFLENSNNLEKVILPSTMKSLAGSVFRNCTSLTEINVPEGIITLPDGCFANCSSLRNITLPSSIQFISAAAFEGDGEMTLRFLSATPPIGEHSNMHFLSTIVGKTIKVPPASVAAYKAAPMWSNYESIIIADDGL